MRNQLAHSIWPQIKLFSGWVHERNATYGFFSRYFRLIIWMVMFPVDILLTAFFWPISDNLFSALQIIAAAGTSGRPRTFKKVSIIHSISSIHTFTFIVSFILTLQRSYESKFISTLNHGSVRHSL